MNKKSFITGILTGVAGSLLLVLVAAFLLVQNGSLNVTRMLGISDNHTALENKIMDKVNVIEGYIDQYFLDKIDEDKMADAVYKGVINGLNDTYAAYYTSDEYKDIMEKTQGSYCGIGEYVSADQDSGAITIVKPMKDSPCEKAGAKAGDIIYSVDGTEVTGKEISQVQAMLKGEKGTKVDMVLLRGQKQVKITVTRDNIEEDTVAYQMLDKKIGYIQVSGFEEVTAKQFEQAVDELEKQGEKALIIDLRENGGGLLDSAVKMLDRMLPQGVVVYSKDKSGTKEEYKATDDKEFKKPLAILVNGNSASASEVFSGAIQDEKKGVLVGTQTFGKGIVQGVFPLGDGSALKMTTAKYYTPNGRNIHEKGLTPDIKVELSEQIQKLPESNKKVDNQLKTAFDYLLKQE